MITIKEYISTIYSDFEKYISSGNRLCDLKSLNYQAGKKPDYTNIHIQQFYLLRYGFAYAFEYKIMFQYLFRKNKIQSPIKVASIGCGSLIDYWGLIEAMKEEKIPSYQVKYAGVDVVDWNYKVEARNGDVVKFLCTGAANVFNNTKNLASDIYIFPKSISEFTENDFRTICDNFRDTHISTDVFYVLISLRADEGSMDIDLARSAKLVEAIKHNGFALKEDSGVLEYKDGNIGIKRLDSKFEYLNDAVNLLSTLNQKCERYIETGKNCDDFGCKSYLSRWPILKAKNIRFQILTFERGGK